VLTCGLILNHGDMLIIFFGLPLRPYVALYLWVDTNIVGSERKVPIKVPINYFIFFDFYFIDQFYFTLPIKFILWGKLKLTPLTCMCMGIPVGKGKIYGWFPYE
jgi:hypothetical protein